MTDFHHLPVLGARVADLFAEVPPGVFVDATLGGAGHARLVLDANPGLVLVGIDRDADALAAATVALEPYGARVLALRHARFDRLAQTMAELGVPNISGALFDLGVSSPQLDRADRGFSYRHEGPLDMRMDRRFDTQTAGDVVNGYDEARLADIFRRFGDERFADRIARAIVAARPIESTSELAEIVKSAIPAPARRRGGHPAKRVFQAIRIEVNRELEVLPDAIDQAVELLEPHGRLAVISYHSGEDRIVKRRFRHHVTGGCSCPAGLPCVCSAVRTVRLVRAGAWAPTEAEVVENPRAQSAHLRAVERLAAG